MKILNAALIISISFTTLQVSANDWPQYLGPDRNAVSAEKGLMRSWPAEGPKVLWSVPLGEGFGGPAVSKGKVYVYDRVEDRVNVLRCLDLMTGNEEWTFSYEAPGSVSYDGSRSVPSVDITRVYVCDVFGNFHCIDINTRKALWNRNIWTDFSKKEIPMWAIAQNPLVYKNMVIIASQTEDTGIVAYDKVNGDIIWKTPSLPGDAGYVSPKIVKIQDEDHLVMVSASRYEGSEGAVCGYNPLNGNFLWSYTWRCKTPVPNVTVTGNNRLFVTGGYRAGGALIEVEKKDTGYAVKEIMFSREFGTHVHPALFYKGHLYSQCTNNQVREGFMCMDLSGNIKWKTGKNPHFDKGGYILADDMIISSDGEKMLYLIEPTPTEFRVLAKAELLETKQAWAPLALSDGKLLIRDQKQMKCVVVK
ncbi:MAG: PQQ-binding-like beta-propeller repeat protein [Deltaproteobacteria bacterium]|nr:PQQ-binding-like beta-propeller repeat protein [Deltaproteobacteria bacterium]